MPVRRASRPSCPKRGERFEGLIPPIVQAPCFAIRKPAVAIFGLADYVAAGIMTAAEGADAARCGRRAPQHPRRRRHVDWQDDARQRALGRDRDERRPRRAHRGHARAAMRRAQFGRAPHQGWRRVLVRAGALVAAAAPRPHPHRRSARRRGARSAQSLGHRPPRWRRHNPRRLGAGRAASHGAADPGSRGHGAARADRGDDRSCRRACRSRGSERRLAELARVTGLSPAGDYLLTPVGDPSC